MDFFSHQDRARRNTGKLVLLFILGMIGVIAATYVLVVACTVGLKYAGFDVPVGTTTSYRDAIETTADGGEAGEVGIPRPPGAIDTLLRWDLLGWVGLGVLVVVGGGSAYKLAQLSGGGQVVALHLGGRLVSHDARDPLERKLLNVVEEMAIASGVPVPPVYMMDDEPNVNAFAAGYTTGDAVIGVTRGCVEKLNRDQLQGVIAHEFSHILHGDMRLNIRLIGVLHGILLIGIIGYYILRSAMYSGHAYQRRDSRDRGNPLPLLALGGGLMVVGFIGTFFGNMIKAAVSRQREFLADASAVQFTRNPDSIAGALKVIGGYEKGSKVLSPNAPEASHMFFGQAITSGLAGLFATHPPIDERIRRVDQYWEIAKADRGTRDAEPGAGKDVGVQASGFSSGVRVPSTALEAAGQPTEAHVAYAHDLIGGMPPALTEAAHEPFSARAVVYAMLIDPRPDIAQPQLAALERSNDPEVARETHRLTPAARTLDPKARLPLVDLVIGTLHQLTTRQREQFIATVDALVRADRRVSLFEWVLQRVIVHHLETPRPPVVKHHTLDAVASEASILLSALAYTGQRNAAAAAQAFAAAVKVPPSITLLPLEACGLDRLDPALNELATLAPKPKRGLLTAAASVINADRQVTAGEAELFRAVADTLGVPVPPLLPGQSLV